MNSTDNLTHECNLLGLYSPGERPVPAAMLWVGLVYCYCIFVIGTLSIALALWCVVTCTKTRRPVKVLLFSVFLPVLGNCLGTGPVAGEFRISLLTCDPHRISKTVIGINMFVFGILMLTELTSIAAIAVVRAAAIWAPQRPKLGIRGAVVLVVVTWIYGILSSLGLMKLTAVGLQKINQQTVTFVTIIFFVTVTLPVLITATAYILMIFVIQRNKRRLVAYQQQARVTTTMDQATRAMLAVFISNLLFMLPHSIYLLTGRQPLYMNEIFNMIYSAHLVVDPLAYIWFNSGYRRKVLSLIRKVIQSMSSWRMTPAVLQTGSSASCDQQKQQKSSTHIHEENNL